MATTPVDPRVVAEMQTCLAMEGDFANPASQHSLGLQARQRVKHAQSQVANLIHAEPSDIIWTSGATESINLALKGVSHFYQRQGRHIITMSTEHKATLEACRYLQSQHFDVTYLDPEKNGLLDLDKLRAAIRSDTILASIMHVNNEIGVIQDVAAIGAILRERGVWFHVDAAQSVGKIPIDLRELPVDLVSLTSHKIYGPKGIGALYVRRKPRVQLVPQMHGGDADNALRAGTLPTHQIVGMGKAFEVAAQQLQEEATRIQTLRDRLWKNISELPGILVNGDLSQRVGGCLNVQITGVDAEKLLLNLHDVAISTGSACNAVDPLPSHVLMAMGLNHDAANQSVRLSVGRFTTTEEIDRASHDIVSAVIALRNNK